MGRSPLILAALAKDAVPALDFVQVAPLSNNNNGAFDSALLTATTGEHYVIRMALGRSNQIHLDTELMGLKAISSQKNNLPFDLTRLVGTTLDAHGNRAYLFTYVYGQPIDLGSLGSDDPLGESLGKALAAIHNLPLSVVEDAGLPVYDAKTVLHQKVALLDRAAQTGKVPAVLLNRWESALDDVNLWRFNPAVIHGDANGHSFVGFNGAVTGVITWGSLIIGDPAQDFGWALDSASADLAYNMLLAYSAARVGGVDDNLRARARLYAEMNVAQWLLHCININDQANIDDAEGMLMSMAADVENGAAPLLTPKPLGQPAAELSFAIDLSEQLDVPYVPVVEVVAEPVVAARVVAAPMVSGFEPEVIEAEAVAAFETQVGASTKVGFEAVADANFDHNKLFGETSPIDLTPLPAFLDDATAPITVAEDTTQKPRPELF